MFKNVFLRIYLYLKQHTIVYGYKSQEPGCIEDVDLGIIEVIHVSRIKLVNRWDSSEKYKNNEFERTVVNLNIREIGRTEAQK